MNQAQPQQCQFCDKQFKNVNLHITTKHKKVLCNGCNKYFDIKWMINELGGKRQGKYTSGSLCPDCFGAGDKEYDAFDASEGIPARKN